MTSYHDELKALAESIGSDGCTHALEIDVDCCWEHDYACVTGMTPRGVVVSKEEANQRFRDCIQSKSRLRFLSPMSWWRYIGVTIGARGIWDKRERYSPISFLAYPNAVETLREAREERARIVAEIYGGAK